MKSISIALVGNPNSGKTTVFNALTGARQTVANWPGVTVEKKSGIFQQDDITIDVVDLPGTYSLTTISETGSIDERIACDYILNRNADIIVNILDASNLERSLYLTLQLLEMQIPIILGFNMMDIVRLRHQSIDVIQIAKILDCEFVILEANHGMGIKDLKKLIIHHAKNKSSFQLRYPDAIETIIDHLSLLCQKSGCEDDGFKRWLSIRFLENDVTVCSFFKETVSIEEPILTEDIDILLADARYRFIETLCSQYVKHAKKNNKTLTQVIDKIVLNRVLGIPIFLSVMYLMFFFAINIGGAFQDFFDGVSNAIFVEGITTILTSLHSPEWMIAFIANGIGKGINTTLTFIPIIGALFLFLSFLEDSGYMARASFVVDRLMRALGLPGKSFVPMIVGFGCNVPAVIGTRTLENKRDRILTIMMTPFMSCGARLAIYAVFVAAFFPRDGQTIVFFLYLLGILMAMLTGFLLRKTMLQGDPAPLIMELPTYHIPHFKSLWINAWYRLKMFVFRAGKLIIPICVLLGFLGSLHLDGSIVYEEGDPNSLLALFGQTLTPLFAPMGIQMDNWPATVGLLTGVLAKEVVIGSLNALYSHLNAIPDAATSVFHFWEQIKAACLTIPANLSGLMSAFSNPFFAGEPEVSQSIYGQMVHRFDGQIGAIAYLIFVLLYFPCISTTAAIQRELNRFWAYFSVLWSTGIAYGIAVLFYQAATFIHHPLSSFVWILTLLLSFILFVVLTKHARGRYEFVGT